MGTRKINDHEGQISYIAQPAGSGRLRLDDKFDLATRSRPARGYGVPAQ